MKATKRKPFDCAMAFCHRDGLVPAWNQAMTFAGKDGRIATMPDIIAARLATKPGDDPWEKYFTTLTAEYLGYSKKGDLILIVAHGIGPMSTLDGILKAYSWQFKDKQRIRKGGRITQEEFWDLESGHYGEVSIIDFASYCKRYEYPFIEALSTSQVLMDPLIRARLGPRVREYALAHHAAATQWRLKNVRLDPEEENQLRKIGLEFDSNFDSIIQNLHDWARADQYILFLWGGECNYNRFDLSRRGTEYIEKGYAVAHLISMSGLQNAHHDGHVSLLNDVKCHDWLNNVRLVGIKAGCDLTSGLHGGPNARSLLFNYWQDLLEPIEQSVSLGFRSLMLIGRQWFTQYPKTGMSTKEPEYIVTSKKKIGVPVLYRTNISDVFEFFLFDLNEMQSIAPTGANACVIEGEFKAKYKSGNPTGITFNVQFYQIEVDKTKRVIRLDQLVHDYNKIMELLAKNN